MSPQFFLSVEVAGAALHVRSDDEAFLDEIAARLGHPGSTTTRAPRALAARVVSQRDSTALGDLEVSAVGDMDLAPVSFLDALRSGVLPLRSTEPPRNGWSMITLDDATPRLFMNGRRCRFETAGPWRAVLAFFLFQWLLHCRCDALFLHAASVAVHGRGVLIVGPKGAGKTTTALALATRGHQLLGDDTACYLPASGELVPFRRSVTIKPGPRARAVDRALERADTIPGADGFFRVGMESLVTDIRREPLALSAVVFLDGFSAEPGIARIAPSPGTLALLQPLGASLANASHTQRVFEMTRLLSRAALHRLRPGDPDQTAALVEETMRPRG